MLALMNTSQAQFVHLHTFNCEVYSIYDVCFYHLYNEADRTLDTFDIFNEDYSFYKQIIIPEIPGIKLSDWDFDLSKRIFDTDNEYEYMVSYFTSTYDTSMIIIYNEDGSILKQFGIYYGRVYSQLYDEDNNYILKLRYWNPSTGYTDSTVYYRLPGKVQEAAHLKKSTNSVRRPYPNPTDEKITIEYFLPVNETAVLSIYSQEGKQIDRIMIGGAFNHLQVDVSQYKPGIYYYQYNNQRGRFVVY